MSQDTRDLSLLRPLAERYAQIARDPVQVERIERYRRTIALEKVPPVLLIDEVPWGEIRDEALRTRSVEERYKTLEQRLRRVLYQWEHWQVDTVIPPVWRVPKRAVSSGIGLAIQETQIESGTGSYASSHRYVDQLATEADLDRLRIPTIRYDREATEREADCAREVFEGLLPVEVVGSIFGFAIWDWVCQLRGADALLEDLAARPVFMHETARKFLEIGKAVFKQYLELDLLETHPVLIHCTAASTRELPAPDYRGTVRPRDVWGRCAAQIFSAVSPAMHDELDLVYNQELFGECGLLYYGCCEPLDGKIELLRRRFPNLRKVSITPWADPEVAAREIGRDFVLAAKPNPAFVSSATFHPQPVIQELERYLEACKTHGTVCELVLKDISTISGNPDNLTQWADTARSVIDRYV